MSRIRPEPVPELEGEQEVDLGRYAGAVAARWWLALVGLVLGLVAGYLLSVSGGDVYRAEAILYLGQPFSPSGGAPVQSLATNPRTVAEIVRSESALRAAARAAGTRPRALRGNVSTQTLMTTGLPRTGATPLVEVAVELDAPGKAARAANVLAREVVENEGVADYVETKIDTFNRQLETMQTQLAAVATLVNDLNRALEEERDLTALDRLVLSSRLDSAEQRRGQLVQVQAQTEQQLALARNVERSRVVEPAIAERTTARSRRNSLLVGGALGLLLGLAAALLWEPVADRFGRRRT